MIEFIKSHYLAIAFTAFALGYIASWISHGKLIQRIRYTYYYMNHGHHTLKNAWNYAGRTI